MLQSMGLQRVEHNLVIEHVHSKQTELSLHIEGGFCLLGNAKAFNYRVFKC